MLTLIVSFAALTAAVLVAVGLKNRRRSRMSISLVGSRELPVEVLTEGNTNHRHRLEPVEWDREKLGKDVESPEGDLLSPMAVYKYLKRCSCGREVVRSVLARS